MACTVAAFIVMAYMAVHFVGLLVGRRHVRRWLMAGRACAHPYLHCSPLTAHRSPHATHHTPHSTLHTPHSTNHTHPSLSHTHTHPAPATNVPLLTVLKVDLATALISGKHSAKAPVAKSHACTRALPNWLSVDPAVLVGPCAPCRGLCARSPAASLADRQQEIILAAGYSWRYLAHTFFHNSYHRCEGTCAVGHYCPNSSTTATAIQCPQGRFNPSRGMGSLDNCLDTPAGLCNPDSRCRATLRASQPTHLPLIILSPPPIPSRRRPIHTADHPTLFTAACRPLQPTR